MTSLTVDQIHRKAGNGGITMNQFSTLLRVGMDSRGRAFGMEMHGTTLFAGDRVQRVMTPRADKLIKKLKRDGPNTLTDIFYDRVYLSPLLDFVVRYRSKEITPFQVLALHDIDSLMVARNRAVELSRKYHADSEEQDSVEEDYWDPTPNNLDLINTMFKFDQPPRKRQYEKDRKKKRSSN